MARRTTRESIITIGIIGENNIGSKKTEERMRSEKWAQIVNH